MTGRRLGFIGLGNMGGRMARRLVDAGHLVLGYDVDPERAAKVGVEAFASISDVAVATDCILLSLPDSSVVEKVVEGRGGLLEASRRGQVIIDLSTAAPSSTQRLHGLLGGKGVELVDAGISGGAAAAENGTLTIMAGGRKTVVDGLAWVFEPIASKVHWMGESGAGHSTKLLNNFLNAVSLAASAEVLLAARQAGLDLATVLEVINSSSGVNFATLNRFPRIIEGDYLEGGLTSKLMLKDVIMYVEHVRELGVPSLNAAGPIASFGAASQLGYGDQISNRVVDALGDLCGGIRLQPGGEL